MFGHYQSAMGVPHGARNMNVNSTLIHHQSRMERAINQEKPAQQHRSSINSNLIPEQPDFSRKSSFTGRKNSSTVFESDPVVLPRRMSRMGESSICLGNSDSFTTNFESLPKKTAPVNPMRPPDCLTTGLHDRRSDGGNWRPSVQTNIAPEPCLGRGLIPKGLENVDLGLLMNSKPDDCVQQFTRKYGLIQ
jgi:hypothetical protein